MYGIRNFCKKDLLGTLLFLADAGFNLIEPCVLLGAPKNNFGLWSQNDLICNMPLLRDLDFHVLSCHIFITDWELAFEQLEQLIDTCQIRQFVVNFPQSIDENSCRKFAEYCTHLGSWLKSRNCELLLHNNVSEIQHKLGGITAYEWMLNQCSGSVGSQPDVGWLIAGGVDPASFLRQNAQFIRSIHYKDLIQCNREFEEVPLGKGQLDLNACIHFATTAQIPQIIDQDKESESMLLELAASAERILHTPTRL